MRITCTVAVLVCIATCVACGNEIDGFRLGMSVDKIKQLANEKGYSFSNGIKGGDRWVSYVLMRDGLSISFCDATLSAISTQRASNLPEATSVLRDWRNALGEPDISANPT
jgi:hypothetical protein